MTDEASPVMCKQVSLAVAAALLSAATLFGQALNTLSAEDRAQGWQLRFDGKTLAGWHVSAPPQGGGRTGPPPTPQPGQVGTPNPCAGAAAASARGVPAGGSHWEVVDGLLTA